MRYDRRMYKKAKRILKYTYLKGFTLIELLIIVAIIGILASAIITFAKEGINKAYDANIRSTLSSLRSSSVYEALNYDPYSFIDVCTGSPVDLILKKLGDTNGFVGADYQCTARPNEWAAIFPLKSKPGYYCVDGNGASQYVSGFLDSALDGTINCNHATLIPVATPTPEPPPPPPVEPETTVCNDGLDNDSDGFIDYPNDLGCDSLPDADEVNTPLANTPPVLTLTGANPYEFWNPSMNPFVGEGNNKYQEPGYTAIDSEQGVISNQVVVTGPTLISGTTGGCRIYTYQFVYQIIDAGGLSDGDTRTVIHHKCNQP